MDGRKGYKGGMQTKRKGLHKESVQALSQRPREGRFDEKQNKWEGLEVYTTHDYRATLKRHFYCQQAQGWGVNIFLIACIQPDI